jgi:two-component system CAI-1 autoinducer sensor kinase/phosphatase CqsS
MSALLYLILLIDTINVILCSFLGTALGLLCYILLFDDYVIAPDFFYYIPVFAFVLAGAVLFNYSEERIRREGRMRALTAIGSSIAHEMRTPLLGIRFDADSVQQLLPRLLKGHDWAVEQGWRQKPLPHDERQEMEEALDRIIRQTGYANTMINILLTNIGDQRIDPANFDRYQMADTVRQTLDSYPFIDDERKKVGWQDGSDFVFFGSDLLMRHVLFNLLKNGLRALAEASKGGITIRLEHGEAANRLVFRDTGTGIAEDQVPLLFEPFYTSRRDGTRVGIGLTFCQRCIDSFGGTITCRSELGSYTEFEISLPCAVPDTNDIIHG